MFRVFTDDLGDERSYFRKISRGYGFTNNEAEAGQFPEAEAKRLELAAACGGLSAFRQKV